MTTAGARPDDPATMPERYADLAQKVFALAEPFGCADLVETDVNGQYFVNEKLTDGPVQEKLEQFTEDLFWGDLVNRLAERDLRRKLGATKLSDELTEEEEGRLSALEDGYWREFETKGVDDVIFFGIRLAVEEQSRLAEMIQEAGASLAHFPGVDALGIGGEPSFHGLGLKGTAAAERVRIIA